MDCKLSALFGGPASPEEEVEYRAMLRDMEKNTRTLYKAETSDGGNSATVEEYGGKVIIHTDGGMAYPVANAEEAKRLADALVAGWERKDWRIESRLFPDAPPEDLG